MVIQQQGENPNEVMHLVCQHCLTSQLQAGYTAGLTDKTWKSRGIYATGVGQILLMELHISFS